MGVRSIVDHLTRLGHERIAFVLHSRASIHSRARLVAFRHEMEVRRLPLPEAYVVDVDVSEVAHTHDYDLNAGRIAAARLHALDRRPTAIVAAYDMVALGVLAGAREADWDVPGQVSVTGFDDIPVAAVASPGLTTAHVPMYEIGRAAVNALIDSLSGPAQRAVIFSPELVIRSSTGPPDVQFVDADLHRARRWTIRSALAGPRPDRPTPPNLRRWTRAPRPTGRP